MTVLRTPKQAAERLQTSVAQVIGLVHDGELKYVNIGRGKKKPRMRFTDDDLDELIERRKRREVCQSTRLQNRRIGNMTSQSEVIAFSALPKPPRSGPRKK